MKIKLIDRTIEELTSKKEIVIYELPDDKDSVIIGREVKCDVRLPKNGYRSNNIDAIVLTVSKQHCLIFEENGRFGIIDYSRYGTCINDRKIESKKRYLLEDGAMLKLGNYELEVKIGDEPELMRVVKE